MQRVNTVLYIIFLEYGKCSNISNTSFYSQIKLALSGLEFIKRLIEYQQGWPWSVCSVSALFVWTVFAGLLVSKFLENLPYNEEGCVYCFNINPCPPDPWYILFWKHCRSGSAGFWWNHLTRIHSVFNHTIESTVINGIVEDGYSMLINSAGQWFKDTAVAIGIDHTCIWSTHSQ